MFTTVKCLLLKQPLTVARHIVSFWVLLSIAQQKLVRIYSYLHFFLKIESNVHMTLSFSLSIYFKINEKCLEIICIFLFEIDNTIAFQLEVGVEHRDAVRVNSKTIVVAHYCIEFFIILFETIYTARESNLFEAIVSPDKLHNFTHLDYRFDQTECVSFFFIVD